MREERNPTNVFARDCITTALIQLMGEKAYKDITITEIARKAGVSRVTYYRNFSSKEDIIIQHFEDIHKEFHKTVKNLDPNKHRYECLVKYFQTWLKHNEFLICLSKANLSPLLLESINDFTRLSLSSAYKYQAFFFTGSIHNVLFEWAKEGTKESAEEMAAFLVDMIKPPPLPLALG